jgi:hypothetical protein
MAIRIDIESSWETDDGEGRRVEVSVAERSHPGEDPLEDSYWFAGGDLERLKHFIGDLIDEKAELFLGRELRECARCRRVFHWRADPELTCNDCQNESSSI